MKKTIRKSLALLLAVLMLMTVSPMGFATELNPDCEHEFTLISFNWKDEDKSCDFTLKCSKCEGEKTVNVPSTESDKQDPTCTAEGSVTVAAVCPEISPVIIKTKVYTIGARGHDFTAPDLTNAEAVAARINKLGNGTHNWKCANEGCDAVGMKKLKEGSETEYEMVVDATEACSGGTATCTDKAKCDICGEEYGQELKHEMQPTAAKAATCEENGNPAYWYCDKCKTYYKDEEGNVKFVITEENNPLVIPALGGTCEMSDKWTFIGKDGNPFNCEEGGTKVKVCIHCNVPMTTPVEVEPDAHSVGDDWIYKANDDTDFVCAAGGKRYKECTVCGAKFGEEPVEASDKHEWEMVDAVAATCGKPGHDAYKKCKRCRIERALDNSETITVYPALPHQWDHVEAQTPTCSEAGVKEHYVCRNCGKLSWTDNGLDPIEDIKDEDGKVIETAQEQVTDPKIAHDFETDVNAKDASCTLAGRKEVFKCKTKGCGQMAVIADMVDGKPEEGAYQIGEVYYKDITDLNEAKTEPLGHRWFDDDKEGSVGYVKPECNKEGQHIKYCLRCGQKETVVDPALEHVKDEQVRDAEGNPAGGPATCTDPAYELWTCANCGEEFKVFSTEEPLGHPWGDSLVVVVEPSCTSKGAHGYKCDRCGATKDVVYDIDMIEHTWADDNKEATCTEDGYTRKVCSVCGAVKDEVVVKGEHVDKDPADGYCDRCGTYISCDHICHKTDAFSKIIWFIMNVWNQFLGINQTCKCGQLHYEKATNIVVPD